MDPAALRDLARRAALVGAAEVREGARGAALDPEGKGLPGDWVTRVDVSTELAIKAFLAAEGPAIEFHGEETGGGTTGLRWVVDPLDGTTNFVHGHPFWSVSIGLMEDDRPVAGAVVAPSLGLSWRGFVDPDARPDQAVVEQEERDDQDDDDDDDDDDGDQRDTSVRSTSERGEAIILRTRRPGPGFRSQPGLLHARPAVTRARS